MYEDNKPIKEDKKIITVKKLSIDEDSSKIEVIDYKEIGIEKQIYRLNKLEFFLDDHGNVFYAEPLQDIFYINEENVFNYVSLQEDITFKQCFLKNQTIVLKGE